MGHGHGPGGAAALQSFGDDAKIAISCVVDQKGDSKQAAEVGIVIYEKYAQFSQIVFFYHENRFFEKSAHFNSTQIAFLIDDLVTAGVERLRLAKTTP